ncbi:hypothetical protein ACI2KR_08690 [Pseudomonas luteola]
MQDLKAFTNIIEELKELNGETLKLPLPRRSEFKPVIELKKMHFGKFWDKVVQVAGMELSTPEMLEILFRIPGFETQMSQIGIHHASLTSQLLSIRHFAKKAPIMTITQALVDLLNDTGIKDDVPCKYFAPPNRTVYIEFNAAEARNLAIHRLRSEGIEYLCEGCYVQERILDHAPRMSSAAREALEIDPHKRTRIIEVGFTASPYGNEAFLKSNAIPVTCDLIDFATIYIQDENEPLAEMLQKHLIFSRSIAAETGSLSAQHLEDFEKRFTEGFSQLAKILFYLHVERRERIEVNEKSLIEERLKKTAPKKHGKLCRSVERHWSSKRACYDTG